MDKEEMKTIKKLVWKKLFTVLTAITNTSDPEQDKNAVEAARGLTNVLLNLQLVKPDPDETEEEEAE